MTALTTTTTEVAHHDGAAPRLTLPRVLRSEWIKQRTLRTTTWTLAGIFFSLVAFGLMAAQISTGSSGTGSGQPSFSGSSSPVDIVLAGANFAILVVAVLGVVVGAREFSSGMIRATVAAVPSRVSVLAGKVVAFVAMMTPVVLVGTLVAFFGGMAILSNAGAASASWSDPDVARAVLGTVAYLVGLGVIGVCLGVVLRSIAAGTATLIGGLMFVPTLAQALLPSSWDTVLKFLPSNAGLSFSSVTASPELLSPGAAGLVFTSWVLVSLVLAAVTFHRRDV